MAHKQNVKHKQESFLPGSMWAMGYIMVGNKSSCILSQDEKKGFKTDSKALP